MKRQRTEGGSAVPADLRTFDPKRENLSQWSTRRRLWAAEHGWPGGAAVRLREEWRTRRRATGLPT